MFHGAKSFQALCSLLAQGALLMSTIPLPNSAYGQTSLPPGAPPAAHSLSDILEYISSGWDSLTRAMNRCESLEDTKTGGEAVLYLPADMAVPATVGELQGHCRVRVEHLPAKITGPGQVDLSAIPAEGLLYLEHPYVVPGGQFNEMYGWDSYFIIRGLLRDNRTELAKGMVDNFFFEIDNYGGVLNANRTYYLTRSQPPFLTSMILAVYDSEAADGKADRVWLEKAYQFARRDYKQWNEQPHLAGNTGLSRYFDHGDGPVPEIMGDPSHYYRGAAYFLLAHDRTFHSYLVHDNDHSVAGKTIGPRFPVFDCNPDTADIAASECKPASSVGLSADFYKGDRSMRESGFDVSFRFGPFGAATHHFAPVCLNSLLYKSEKDLERISTLLGHPEDAKAWSAKSEERRKRVLEYFWDAREGLFFDYNIVSKSRSKYEYATTFYPLWAGLASKAQADAVARNVNKFEQAGGLAMSRIESQAQWDFPYGWAPIQLLAIEGLRRYGYDREADRLSDKFLLMVLENFRRDHTIREKYNVVTRSSETAVVEGYSQNVTGFGWTNGVFLELLHESPGATARLTAQRERTSDADIKNKIEKK
jgi:alpha,alpha-trehalase